MFLFFFLCVILSVLILFLFFLSSKSEKWDYFLASSFECGFSSYFYSRFSFSIHYFLVGLIFLFLDLELCILMPFLNVFSSNLVIVFISIMFVMVLLSGLLLEWKEKKLEWIS